MRRTIILLSTIFLMLLMLIPISGADAADANLQGWVHQVSGVTDRLMAVRALDANTAWACGWSDCILKTTDGGTHWVKQTVPTTNKDLQDISVVTGNIAWVVGHSNTVLRTTNGGTVWAPPATDPPILTTNLAGVQAFSAQEAWAVGDSGTIVRTANGGGSWTLQSTPTTRDLFGISAADRNNAWAVGNEGALLHTTNGGATWRAQTATGKKLRGVQALSKDVAWICGFDGQVWKTYDAGATWHQQPVPTDQILFGISAVNNNTAWTVGYDDFVTDEGIILKTTADGADWHNQFGSTNNLYDVAAVNAMTAWAVGDNGEILKTTNGGEWYRTWYLAEGATLGGFETWVLIQNPGASEATVNLTYMTENGEVAGPTFKLEGESRQSINVGDTVQSYKVSTYVTSDKPVIAERAMYWGNRKAGHDSIGTAAPSMTWYLAEGATLGSFETWVLVQNPTDEAADVTLTYMTDQGEVPGPQISLGAQSRESINVGDTVQTYKVSTRVTASRPVIAERAMYWNNRMGGHDSIGVTGPATQWYLAEGATLGTFETWVLVQNPTGAPSDVKLTFMTDQGEVPGPQFTLAANSRESINVADTVKTFKVSTLVEASTPVIAERAMYWNNRIDGHDSIGTTTPDTTWYLAEGATLGGFETWVLVQNPGDETARVTFTYMTDNGEVPGPTIDLAANSRESIFVADTVQSFKVSTRVTSNRPVIAERAMYWGNRTGGHDSIGLGL